MLGQSGCSFAKSTCFAKLVGGFCEGDVNLVVIKSTCEMKDYIRQISCVIGRKRTLF